MSSEPIIDAEFEAEDDVALAIVDDDADERMALANWQPIETGLESACYNVAVAAAACAGMKLAKPNPQKRGEKMPLLFYDRGRQGRGLNKVVAKALMSARGNFEIVDYKLAEGIVTVGAVVSGERKVERIEAWECCVRVRDLLTNTVTMGRRTEPIFAKRQDGSWYCLPEPAGSAYTKALRNAILDHFEAINDGLFAALENEYEAGNEYFTGNIAGAEDGQAWRDQAMTKQQAASEGKIGSREAQILHREVGDLEREAGMDPGKLIAEFKDYAARRWPRTRIPDLPTSARAELTEWLQGKREALAGGSPTNAPNVAEDAATGEDGLSEDEMANATIEELVEAGKLPRDVADELKQVVDPVERLKAARLATSGGA